MLKYEEKFIKFCEKHYLLISFIILTLLSLLIRLFMLDFESGDYLAFLEHWFDHLKNNGGLFALRDYPGDYNAPYMIIMALLTYIPFNKLYLIKSVSIFFDFLLAFSSSLLVKELVVDKKKKNFVLLITYSIVLMLPTVVMNSAMWGQCDSIYATFVILSLLFLIKERYIPSFIMLGFSFSFKLQFIFILPLYVIIYVVKKNFSILHFLLIPYVNIIMCLPAVIFGNSFVKCMTVYFNQVSTYKDSLVLNFPNIYNLIGGNVEIFYSVGVIFALFICILSLIYIIYKKIKFNNEKIMNLGLWFIVIMTFILPGMHERYMFCGEIIAVIYYIVYRKNLLLLIFIILSSIITYSSYLNGLSFSYMQLMSIIYTIIIFYFTKCTLNVLNDKGVK